MENIHQIKEPGKVAAPILSCAKFKFKICDNSSMHACQNPQTTMQGLHVEKKYLQNGMQKCLDVSTRMIDVDQNIQGAVSCSTASTCGNGPVNIRESLSDDHRHRKFKETTGLKCQH